MINAERMEWQVTSQEGLLEEERRRKGHGAGLTRLSCSEHVTLELPLETSRVGGLQDHAHSCPSPPQAALLLYTIHACNIVHTGGPRHPGFLMELRSASRTSGREARRFLLLIALPHPKMG